MSEVSGQSVSGADSGAERKMERSVPKNRLERSGAVSGPICRSKSRSTVNALTKKVKSIC